MTKVIKHSTPPYNYEVTVPDELDTLYVDGVSSINVGLPVSFLTFHQVSPPIFGEPPPKSGEPEKRRAVLELRMPTPALIDLAQSILRTAALNKQKLEQGIDTTGTQLKAMLNTL